MISLMLMKRHDGGILMGAPPNDLLKNRMSFGNAEDYPYSSDRTHILGEDKEYGLSILVSLFLFDN